MMSSNEVGPPIAIPDFKGFLEGKPVDGYPDNGADVWMTIKQRFAQEMRSRFRMRVESKSSLPLWKVIDTTLHILADCIQFDVEVDDNIKEFIIQDWLNEFAAAVRSSRQKPDSPGGHRFDEGWNTLQALVDPYLNSATVPQV